MKKIYFFEGVKYGSAEYHRLRYQIKKEDIRKRHSEYEKRKNMESPGRGTAKVLKYNGRYPWKPRARELVKLAILRGDLGRQPCEVCGAENANAHHEYYGQPLDVRWYCPVHHTARHEVMQLEGVNSKPNETDMAALFTRRPTCLPKPTCKLGHPWDESTIYISPKNQKRSCRVCNGERAKRRKRGRKG